LIPTIDNLLNFKGEGKKLKRKAVSGIMLTLILTSMLTLAFNIQTVSADVYPVIYVKPATTVDPTLTPGKNYTVSIYTDYNGSDIWGWEFDLTYNPLVLHGIEVTNGDLITTAKDPSALFLPGTFDNIAGELTKTANAFFLTEPGDPLPVTSGPGTLANVTFEVVGTGDSSITLGTEPLAPTRLVGINATTEEEYNIIDDATPDTGHILNGYFRNTAAPVIHDIAVISVTPNTTSVVVGEPVDITVVVENQGNVKEKFDVEVYYNYNPHFPTFQRIGTETVSSLSAGATRSLTFTWNTMDVMPGNHTITAVTNELPGETDTDDNTLHSDEIVNVRTLLDLFDSLLADYDDLLDSYDTLVTYFDSLNSSYYGLKSSFESLNSTYYDLLDMYNQLQFDYDDLKSKHDALTGDLGTAWNLSYLLVITTIVFIATTVYLTIRKPKVKPELKTT